MDLKQQLDINELINLPGISRIDSCGNRLSYWENVCREVVIRMADLLLQAVLDVAEAGRREMEVAMYDNGDRPNKKGAQEYLGKKLPRIRDEELFGIKKGEEVPFEDFCDIYKDWASDGRKLAGKEGTV